jgi:hypothetical protein
MNLGAFALVNMQVDLSRCNGAANVAQEVVETFAGTRNAAVDAGAQSVSFEIQFPGNLSALVARLRSNSIPVGDHADVTLPIRRLVPTSGDEEFVRRTLAEGPEIWDVQFERGHYVSDARLDGDRVIASVVPSTNSMHQLYDSLLKLGIVVNAHPHPRSHSPSHAASDG